MITEFTGRVAGGGNLTQDEMEEVVEQIMQGTWKEEQIGLLLMALRAKGESVDEVTGAARAMRRHMTIIGSDRTELLDTCGPGGDASGTFNISTAAALVTAAAGVAVAKHGNRAVTSRTGSADVLARLGVNVEASITQVERCLEQIGICFCFAPLMHPSMKHVAAVRKKLGVPTIFNLLGPLCNPARAPLQLLGVPRPELRPLLAQALHRLGTERAFVVRGDDGLDEVTITTTSQVTEVAAGSDEYREWTWSPAMFGLSMSPVESIVVDGPEASAVVIQKVLDGKPGTARDVVVLNAAAALWLAGKEKSPAECAVRAAAAIDSGAARALLADLVTVSHANH